MDAGEDRSGAPPAPGAPAGASPGFAREAMRYAGIGWRTLPCIGKTPVLPDWPSAATTAGDVIEGWGKQWPTANIGVATGPSGLVVIDVDPRHGGTDTWLRVVDEVGRDTIEATPRARTGGGGLHVVFAAVEGHVIPSGVNVLGPGVDVRARGGQVVVPPSVHPLTGGQYWWVRDPWHHPPVPVPPSLLTLLNDRSPSQQAQSSLAQPIALGRRDVTLASLAGSLHRRRLPKVVIHAALQAVNAMHCRPPLPARRVEQIVDSITRRPGGAA